MPQNDEIQLSNDSDAMYSGWKHYLYIRHTDLCARALITAARPAYAGTEGCYILLVFFISFFI